MNENIKMFVEKVMEDKDLQEKMAALKNPEEAYAFASSLQGGFTLEEFTNAMQELYEATHEWELSDEDLAKAAGGGGDEDFVIFTAMSGVFISAFSVYSAVEVAASAAGAAGASV